MIKLISINIELHKHFKESVLPFLDKEKAEILCVQEIMARDFEFLKTRMSMDGIFAPNAYSKDRDDEWGVGLLSKHHIISGTIDNYRYVDKEVVPLENLIDPDVHHRSLVTANIKLGDRILRVANTQFTWTPDGEADDRQREDIRKLLDLLEKRKSDIITGDFNAPRGREIFSMLAERYKDNIPEHYTTTINNKLHKHGYENLRLVVDGLFTTDAVVVKNVELVDDISDHMAIVAEIE